LKIDRQRLCPWGKSDKNPAKNRKTGGFFKSQKLTIVNYKRRGEGMQYKFVVMRQHICFGKEDIIAAMLKEGRK
jgi:hypothetical protein